MQHSASKTHANFIKQVCTITDVLLIKLSSISSVCGLFQLPNGSADLLNILFRHSAIHSYSKAESLTLFM